MIDHIEIPVSDLKLSRHFYEKAFLPLGFKVSFGEEGKFWAFDLAGKGNGHRWIRSPFEFYSYYVK